MTALAASAHEIFLFEMALKRREVSGPFASATRTLVLLQRVIAAAKVNSAADLLGSLRDLAQRLQKARPLELALGNIVRRAMFFVRDAARTIEEDVEVRKDTPSVQTPVKDELHALFDSPLPSTPRKQRGKPLKVPELSFDEVSTPSPVTPLLSPDLEPALTQHLSAQGARKLREAITERLAELEYELKDAYQSVADQAEMHVHSGDVIMTLGHSQTVRNFLAHAASRGRHFSVIVADGSDGHGAEFALQLASLQGVSAQVIPEAAVLAMMPQATKVVIGTEYVLANGGLVSRCGTRNLCLAAQLHARPVLVLGGMYKLAPLYTFGQHTFNELLPPPTSPPVAADLAAEVDFVIPRFDYVEPALVALFITNTTASEGAAGGNGFAPHFVWKLLSGYYCEADYELN
ncbi:MAG: hypothetical protein MHM6MM_000181 [Cercozoa sp. M6MM]